MSFQMTRIPNKRFERDAPTAGVAARLRVSWTLANRVNAPMKNMAAVAFLFVLLGVPSPSFSEFNEDITRSLTIQCSYSDYKTFQLETVLIEGTKNSRGDTASTKTFQRGEESQNATYLVKPGEVAECVFPSGNRIRAKVGAGTARPYGMCGGDPEVFSSIWVNERKIASRVWFSGHCRAENGNPDVSFKFSGYRNVSVQKCHSMKPIEADASDGDSISESKKPLSVCVDFPDISRFPRDEVEYPRAGRKLPSVGEIELLMGSREVCKAALEELRADFHTFGHYPILGSIKLHRPGWSTPTVELPEELAGSRESVFDFDNDGKLDRVISRDFETNYMDGSVLLVERGLSSTRLIVRGSPMDNSSWFIPCQMSAVRYGIRDCPTFSQKGDDAGFGMKTGGNRYAIYFRARYSSVSPFTFKGESFIGVSSQSEDTSDFVAVLKPMPNKTFQRVCLFKRVTENF